MFKQILLPKMPKVQIKIESKRAIGWTGLDGTWWGEVIWPGCVLFKIFWRPGHLQTSKLVILNRSILHRLNSSLFYIIIFRHIYLALKRLPKNWIKWQKLPKKFTTRFLWREEWNPCHIEHFRFVRIPDKIWIT